MSVARYPVFSVLFKIGVTLAPNGQLLLWLTALGVPTISIITELVSQYDAVQENHREFSMLPNSNMKRKSIPRENHVITSWQML